MAVTEYNTDEIKKIWEDFIVNLLDPSSKVNPAMEAKIIEKLYIITSMADEINHMYDDGDSLEVQ